MGQNRTDHCAPKQCGPDDLAAGQPKQHSAADLYDGCEIAKPLTQADRVISGHHHLGTDELCATGSQKGEGKEAAQADRGICHGIAFSGPEGVFGDKALNKPSRAPECELRSMCALMRHP